MKKAMLSQPMAGKQMKRLLQLGNRQSRSWKPKAMKL